MVEVFTPWTSANATNRIPFPPLASTPHPQESQLLNTDQHMTACSSPIALLSWLWNGKTSCLFTLVPHLTPIPDLEWEYTSKTHPFLCCVIHFATKSQCELLSHHVILSLKTFQRLLVGFRIESCLHIMTNSLFIPLVPSYVFLPLTYQVPVILVCLLSLEHAKVAYLWHLRTPLPRNMPRLPTYGTFAHHCPGTCQGCLPMAPLHTIAPEHAKVAYLWHLHTPLPRNMPRLPTYGTFAHHCPC